MQFSLFITLGEDVTRRDISLALRRVAADLERRGRDATMEEGDEGIIRDLESDEIGSWEVK